MAYMDDTAREFDTFGCEIGLLLEDLFAYILQRDLGGRNVLREAIHGVGRGKEEERWRGRMETIGETYKPFSKEAEPEKEGEGTNMSLITLRRSADGKYILTVDCMRAHSGRVRRFTHLHTYVSRVKSFGIVRRNRKIFKSISCLFSLPYFSPHVRSLTRNHIKYTSVRPG